MKVTHLALMGVAAALTSACATREAEPQTAEIVPPAKVAPPRVAPTKAAPPKGAAPAKGVVKENAMTATPAEGEAPGAGVPGSKFAKLKIGMTLKQVERLIGRPARQWQHSTDKASIPFYFGPDRWVIEYSYKGEGILIFNSGGDQLLSRIEVNKAE